MRYALLALSLLVGPAWADIVASYSIKDGDDLTLSYRDAKHARMQVNADTFVLLSGDKVWTVNREGKGWVAMDMSEMGKMMKGFPMPGARGAGAADDQPARDLSFRKTGKTETVAGYTGNVYVISDASDGESREVVLTDHKDVTQASRAFIALSGAISKSMGFADFNPVEVMEQLEANVESGLLRQEDNMVLKSIDTSKLADTVFQLPAGTRVQSMPAMPAMPKGMPGMPEGFSFPR